VIVSSPLAISSGLILCSDEFRIVDKTVAVGIIHFHDGINQGDKLIVAKDLFLHLICAGVVGVLVPLLCVKQNNTNIADKPQADNTAAWLAGDYQDCHNYNLL